MGDASLRYAYPQMSTNAGKAYMIVIPTPFVITLWVPTTVHADQDSLETEETAAHVQVRL